MPLPTWHWGDRSSVMQCHGWRCYPLCILRLITGRYAHVPKFTASQPRALPCKPQCPARKRYSFGLVSKKSKHGHFMLKFSDKIIFVVFYCSHVLVGLLFRPNGTYCPSFGNVVYALISHKFPYIMIFCQIIPRFTADKIQYGVYSSVNQSILNANQRFLGSTREGYKTKKSPASTLSCYAWPTSPTPGIFHLHHAELKHKSQHEQYSLKSLSQQLDLTSARTAFIENIVPPSWQPLNWYKHCCPEENK